MKRSQPPLGKTVWSVTLAALLAFTGVWGDGQAAGAIQPSRGQSSKSSAGTVRFADIRGHYAAESITRLAETGYVRGVGPGRFDPGRPITRADFALLLGKVAGLQPYQPQWPLFPDVNLGSPHAPYLYALVDAGVLAGRPDGRIGANDVLTRQDLAVLLHRLRKVTGQVPQTPSNPPKRYADDASIAGYAREAVYTVAAQGWMVGHNGRFLPGHPVTRAQAATVADRILSARRSEAEQAAFAAEPEKLELMPGERARIRVKSKYGSPLPFTPVFAFDQPELGEVAADGTFVAGEATGSGLVTVSVGYHTVTVPVEVTDRGPADGGTPPTTPDNTGGSSPQTDVESQGETEGDAFRETHGAALRETYGNPPESRQNLAQDAVVEVMPTGPADPAFQALERKYPGPAGGLATPSETWTGFHRQLGREVTVSLAEPHVLEQIRMTFRQDRKAGILLSEYMDVEVSRDGTAWSYAGRVRHNVSPSDETPQIRTLSLTLPALEARYIRISFPVKVWVFARQLEVLASSPAPFAPHPVWLSPVKPSAFLIDGKAGERLSNLLLVYSGAHGERGTWKSEDFLPLVGYMTEDGRVIDRLFDGMLFLPYPTLPATRDAWEAYLNDLFRPGRQLDALNEAMKEYNRRRGSLSNPTLENVILTLPYPHPTQGNFGRVREDQDSLSFQATAVGEERAYRYRLQALQWYMEELLKRWTEADYRYLRLEGIYWFHELVDDAVPRERQLVQSAAAMVHDRALRFYWIPYMGAPGLTDWRELGFDYAFIQPNYYFSTDTPVERIEVTLKLANQYGMGIEVEGDERMITDLRYYRLYYNQLIAGHRLGIDKHKIHAYYYGSKSLLEAFRSREPHARALYDDTYKWMNGRFTRKEYLTPETLPAEDGGPLTEPTPLAP